MRMCWFYFGLFLSCVSVNLAHAEESPASALTSPANVSDESFSDIAALGQKIALAQRKIEALTLQNNLASLTAAQEGNRFSLRVVRVEGFGDTLYAIVTDSSGAFYQVGPGEFINKQYRVSLLKPYSVGVIDINSDKFYLLPFLRGDVISMDNVNIPNNAAQDSETA